MGIDLLLDEVGHLAFYVLCITPFIFIWRKAFTNQNFLIGLFTSLFIDIDHFFEYLFYLHQTGETFNLPTLLSGSYFGRGTVVIIFHGWEYVLLLLLLFVLIQDKLKSSWLWFVIIGMAAHLTFDILSYGFDPSVYLITRRALYSFSSTIFQRRLIF